MRPAPGSDRTHAPRWRVALTILGVGLLVVPPLTWSLAQPPPSVGDPGVYGLTALAANGADTESEPSATSPGETSPPLVVGAVTRAGALPPPPVRIRLAGHGIDAPVDAVGVDDGGKMAIPTDVARVGWYAPGGIRPGRSGTAVFAAHVDSRTQGLGVFAPLREVTLGDEVTIEHADGTTSRWRVTARTSALKEELDLDTVFSRTGEPRIALITCGGEFDEARRRYAENVVVIAVAA